MIYQCTTGFFLVIIISFIQANDDQNIYKVVSQSSADDYDTKVNIEEIVQFVQLDNKDDLVHVQLYYESLCPGSIEFNVDQFAPTIYALNKYLEIEVYPYGNADTSVVNGRYVFTCQHGPAECYGNMLHACAIDQLKNMTQAILYNTCMMTTGSLKYKGSDDKAARKCGLDMTIDSDPIIACAKGNRGSELLNYYGELSKKANFDAVPYILINGKSYDGDYFLKAVCAAFKNAPPPCNAILH